MDDELRCSRCQLTKPAGEFNRCSRRGHQHFCRDCQSAYHQAHRERNNEHSRRWYRQNRDADLALKRARYWARKARAQGAVIGPVL